MDNKRLFLLDAYALIYRAYYALFRSPRVTSGGINTSAVFGFCNTLDEVLRKEKPTHIAVCFDPRGGHTFRHDAYPEYKAQRDKQPEDISIAVPYIKRILEAYNIPVIEVEGYEADDVIGTLSRRAEAEGFETYMMTPDKDYGQLVTDHVRMYRPALKGQGFEIRGPREVCERYGIERPSQVIDLLALEGDVSDNIPGCPGVGEKTAQKLIAEWGDVEGLIANTDKLKGALQKKIIENADKIRFSKFLVTIKTDVPLDITLDELARKPENVGELIDIYRELEFKTFIRRLTERSDASGFTPAPKAEKPAAEPGMMGSLFDLPDENPVVTCDVTEYTVADTPAAVGKIVSDAMTRSEVGVAFYAVGDEAMTARWLGLAIALDPCSGVYIPLPPAGTERDEMLQVLQPLFESGVTLVGQDIKRFYLLLRREGITMTAPYYDTSVAHYLIDPEVKHDLAPVAYKYLGLEVIHGAKDARKPHPQAELTADESRLRYCEEADVVLRLRPVLAREIHSEQMDELLSEIEFPLITVLADMEWTGVRIDKAELARLHVRLSQRLTDLEEQAYELAGERFNIGSPAQVGIILFDKLAIADKVKKTSKGSYSTTEQVLEKYQDKHPIVGLILKIRRLRKLLATYIDALPLLVNPVTGKIHTSYNQTVTATGRISSTNPNLQNIPIRTDDGRDIRRAFVADPGDLIMSADYSQIELRVIADISADRDMVDAFLSGADIHTLTAAKIYHKNLDEVTADERRHAKTANFGIIYGISAFGLSERLQISRAEAKRLIDGYFETYPHIRQFFDRAIGSAREKGYVTTIKGRKRRLPDINSRNAVVRAYAERNAVNAPIQGSAADIIKIAMVRVARDIAAAGLASRMIMQVHDELIFNVKPDELDRLREIVVRDMADAYHGLVPLEVACGVASNWLDAH